MAQEYKEKALDRFVSYFSPKKGAERLAWRQSNEIMKKSWYDSGNQPNSRWRLPNESAEFTDKWDRDAVRARARDLERNSDIMNAVISAFVRNIYGPGYRLQVKIGDGETQDYTELNKAIEQAWKKWCKKQNCDTTGTQSFNDMMTMCVTRKKVDGAILIVKRYTRGGFIPFVLQTFEVDELDDLTISPKYKNNKVVGGIEYDPQNKPVGYYIRQYTIDGMREIQPVFIKAEDVIFYWSKKRPSQIREMSDLTPTITRIRDVNQYMESVSVKERILACLSIFIKKQTPGASGLGRPSIGASDDELIKYGGKTLSPGMMMELNPGDEIQAVAPSGQTQDASTYIKQQERMLSAGQGMSYEAVSRDMSEVNYSSARQAIIEDERTYGRERELLIEVLDEIYETFVISLWLSGNLTIPDFWENKDKYLEHKWITPSKPWIDPAKEANAGKIALASGQKSFQQMSAENGQDWKAQIDEMSESIKYAKTKGIDLGGVIFGQQQKAESAEDGQAEVTEGDGSSGQKTEPGAD